MDIKTGARGLDYAFGRPTPESILRNGYTFVVRYISVPPASASKNLTPPERDQLLDAGIGILLVWEQSAATPGKGAPEGTNNGLNACKKALSLGYPHDIPILVAVDTDTHGANIAAHEAYVRAFADACLPYPIGVYGDADILLRLGGLSQIGWLPNASAWSSANRAAALSAGRVHVLQRKGYGMEGVAVDPNDVIRPIRAWSHRVPVPVPIPIQTEDDMQIITNSEPMTDAAGTLFAALNLKWKLVLTHEPLYRAAWLAPWEHEASGWAVGIPMSTALLTQIGAWMPPPAPTVAAVAPTAAVAPVAAVAEVAPVAGVAPVGPYTFTGTMTTEPTDE